jgi:hypothetical protein
MKIKGDIKHLPTMGYVPGALYAGIGVPVYAGLDGLAGLGVAADGEAAKKEHPTTTLNTVLHPTACGHRGSFTEDQAPLFMDTSFPLHPWPMLARMTAQLYPPEGVA